MAKVKKVREWRKKRNPAKGVKLQAIANRMLKKGHTGKKYKKIRAAAEYHLGFWAFQTKGPSFGQTNTGFWRSQTDAYLPTACIKVSCPHLPAGSAACIYQGHECP